MNIVGGEDFTRTDTIARMILGELADGEPADDRLILLINLALKVGMDAGLLVLIPQRPSEFPYWRDMTKAEDLLYDPHHLGDDSVKARCKNYLAFKLKLDGFDSTDVYHEDGSCVDVLEATYREGIKIKEWEAAARQMLREAEQDEAA